MGARGGRGSRIDEEQGQPSRERAAHHLGERAVAGKALDQIHREGRHGRGDR